MAGELVFEWDPLKADQVESDHGVTFDEASTVFQDPLAATKRDEAHSADEDRFVTIGTTSAERLVVVVHTPRGSRIRLITAREAPRAEVRTYEQGKGS